MPNLTDGESLAPIFQALGLDSAHAYPARGSGAQKFGALRWAHYQSAAVASQSGAALLEGPCETFVIALETKGSDRELAELRNQLWPRLHVNVILQREDSTWYRRTLQGREKIGIEPVEHVQTVLVAHELAGVMSPDNTTIKFDLNAKKWDGEPGGPGYPHFRWMRRFVALYCVPNQAARILDAGCGAGWVGIEATKRHPQAHLAMFDPSPEMVGIAESNARAEGLHDIDGAVGFVENPPFPRSGEAPFDWVISSGVISFSPDPEAWLDGLVGTLAPGATLVIGDIQARSWGFRKRRKTHPLLPVRELNAKGHAEIRSGLERRGLVYLKGSGYQASFPLPQLMHVNETKLKGLLTWPILWVNQACAGLARLFSGQGGGAFDSWVMSFRKP